MNHTVIQLVLTAVLGTAILGVLAVARRHQMGWRGSLVWLLFWTTGLIAVWFPNLTIQFARVVGVGRGVDAVLYLSIAILSLVAFRLYAALEKQDQVITRIVSELALQSPLDQSQPQATARVIPDADEVAGDCE